MNAAIITGVASPLMILRISASISSWKISRCSIVRCSASCMLIDMMAPSDPLVLRKEIAQQRVAVLGQDRFRMELHALDGELAMAHAHDLAVLALGGDLEARRAAIARSITSE